MDAKLLTRAIRERRVVEFRYDGEPREVEPCRLAEGPEGLLLAGWQRRKGWRTFRLDRMTEVEATERTFDAPREGYAPGGPPGFRVLAEL